jgi:hypothetical protein
VSLLLGAGARDEELDELGAWLERVMSTADEVARTVDFAAWCEACYDTFGEICWRRAQA